MYGCTGGLELKQWIQKLIHQFDVDLGKGEINPKVGLSDERATLIFIIDTFNKNLIEFDNHPVRKMREILDSFARELMDENSNIEKVLFRIRQFFSSYRLDEYSYVQKTFDDFRGIIWDFVDQLSEDFSLERAEDAVMRGNLNKLKEAVEANSIELLRDESRQFIDAYVEYQNTRDNRREERLGIVRENLEGVKKQLVEANQNMRFDHLTKAYNRKSFDEQINRHWKMFQISDVPVVLLALDIDHFKKINDRFGHAIGDHVLIECVKLLNEAFDGDSEFVARVGGEEFAILLPDYRLERAVKKGEKALEKIRKETLVHEGAEIRFTMSMGIAQLHKGESVEAWMKRADAALYESKTNGRNRCTIAMDEDMSSSQVS